MSRRKTIRFGDYIQAMSIDSQKIPYQELMPEPLFDRHGNAKNSIPRINARAIV